MAQGASLMKKHLSVTSFSSKMVPVDNNSVVKIRRGRVSSVDLYEIKDSELDQLEAGSPATLQLNFSIFLVSTSITAITALCTTEKFIYPQIETTFIVVAVVGILGGIFLFFSWMRNRKSTKTVIKRIRQRIEEYSYDSNSDTNVDCSVDNSLPRHAAAPH